MLVSAPGNMKNVVNHGARRGRHDANRIHIRGKRAFSLRVKQALSAELILEGQVSLKQNAHSLRSQRFRVKLILAAARIQPDASADNRAHAFKGFHLQHGALRCVHQAGYGSLLVLERKEQRA